MRYYEWEMDGAEIISASPGAFQMTAYEGKHCAPRKKRSMDIEIGKSVGCFMALVIGITFFILSYL